MTSEQVTVTISASAGEDEPLTVTDAMGQLLDFFELLSASGGKDAESVDWQLVAISMKSPLRATARAISKVPGVLAEPIAQRQKAAVRHSLNQALRRSRASDWSDPKIRNRTKNLFQRSSTVIGRMSIEFEPKEVPTIINQSAAREVVARIDDFEREQQRVQDQSRVEYGSIEGVVVDLTKHHGRPALRVRERLTGDDVVCLISSEHAAQFGPEHSWDEVWSSKRLLFTGRMTFKQNGQLGQIKVDEIEIIGSSTLNFPDIARPGFTGGLSPQESIDVWWDADNG